MENKRQVSVEDNSSSLSHDVSLANNNRPNNYSNNTEEEETSIIEENENILRRDLEQLNLEVDDDGRNNEVASRIIIPLGRTNEATIADRRNNGGDEIVRNEDFNENNNENEDRIQQQNLFRATETIRLGREAINNLEQIGIPIVRQDDDDNNDDQTLNDEDFERLLALCKHNIMSLYYERTSKPHPSNTIRE